MRNALFIIIILLSLSGMASGQNSIAKLKYEEAEEAYSNAEYSTTLKKLAEAEKILGSTNPKILYLKLSTVGKLLSRPGFVDPEIITKVKNECQFYLTEYEKIEGIEEKYRDIYKIFESLDKHKDIIELYNNAVQGNLQSIVKLGRIYTHERTDKAIEWFSKAADKGDNYALNQLGYITLSMKKNAKKAYEFYNKAALNGDANSAASLAYMYEEGYPDFPQDKIKSIEWLQRSADMGNLWSKRKIGDKYLHDSAPIRISKVLSTLTEAISTTPNDHSDSAAITLSYFALAEIYFLGKDSITKDYAKAVMFLEKGHQIAPSHFTSPQIEFITCRNYLLGMIYNEGGYGIKADPIKAFQHFNATATQYSDESTLIGYKKYRKYFSESMQHLSEMYAKGSGVKKDKYLAKEWADKAAVVAAKKE